MKSFENNWYMDKRFYFKLIKVKEKEEKILM